MSATILSFGMGPRGRAWMMTLILVLVTLLPSLLPAQGIKSNMEKYWLLRDRLHQRFIKVGPGQGMSIPASMYKEDFDGWENFAGVQDKDVLFWGDATALLGLYIAMLSTEYAVLRATNDPTERTETELYYALNALWRLDATSGFYSYEDAEYNDGDCYTPNSAIPAPMDAQTYNDTSLLDGFFIRDDVPKDFAQHFPGLYDTVSSDLTAPISHHCRNKEMSQDQATAIILGLSCVKHFVDPWVQFNGVVFRDFAVSEGSLILRHIRATGGWKIRNPHFVSDSLVYRGSSGLGFSVGWVYAGLDLTDGVMNLTNARSGFENPFWQAFQYPFYLIGNTKYMNETMISNIAASGVSWGPCPFVILPGLQYGSCLYATNGTLASTRAGLDRYAGRAKEAQYLIHHLAQNTPWASVNNVSEASMMAMLNTAPCEGPYSIWPASGVYGWTTENRFWVPRMDMDDTNNNLVVGKKLSDGHNYSGIDYMLLHNLYFLWRHHNNHGDPIQFPHENLMYADISHEWPVRVLPWVSTGSVQTPVDVHAIYTLTSNAPVRVFNGGGSAAMRTGDVTYLAGEQIDLMPGFRVEWGAEFDARIAPLTCDSVPGQRLAESKKDIALLHAIADAAEQREYEEMQALERLLLEAQRSSSDTLQVVSLFVWPIPSPGEIEVSFWVPEGQEYELILSGADGKMKVLQKAKSESGAFQDVKFNLIAPAGLYKILLSCPSGMVTRSIMIAPWD